MPGFFYIQFDEAGLIAGLSAELPFGEYSDDKLYSCIDKSSIFQVTTSDVAFPIRHCDMQVRAVPGKGSGQSYDFEMASQHLGFLLICIPDGNSSQAADGGNNAGR